MKALAQAVPEQVMAAGFDTTHSTCLSHLDDQGYSIYLEIFGGGYGDPSRRSSERLVSDRENDAGAASQPHPRSATADLERA